MVEEKPKCGEFAFWNLGLISRNCKEAYWILSKKIESFVSI